MEFYHVFEVSEVTEDMPRSTDSDPDSDSTIAALRRGWQGQPRIIRWPVYTFAIWAVLVMLIQISAPAPNVESMPTSCPEGSLNCVRVAADGTSFRADGLQPPLVEGTIGEARRVIWLWLEEEQGGKHLRSNSEQMGAVLFFHGQDNTQFWFFPDDIFALTECESGGNRTLVTLQSQSRLGVGDIGENHARLSSLITYLNDYQWSGKSCDFFDPDDPINTID